MTYPLDKLGLINQALALSGDNLCNVVQDGSDEWTVGSAAYEAAMEYMLDQHNWKGITDVVTLPRAGTPNDPTFTDAYAKPAGCIHLIWVRLNDRQCIYTILGDQICINAAGEPGGPPGTVPGTVTAKCVFTTNADLANGHLSRTFMTGLLAFVRAGIYGGLHEDPASEQAWMKVGEGILRQARTRSDQEAPKRSFFNNRMRAARRIRRPWPPVSDEWGGTGIPG